MRVSDYTIAVYKAICEYYNAHQYMPSYREIKEATGIGSSATINYQVGKLIKNGYLETDIEDEVIYSRAYRLGGKKL